MSKDKVPATKTNLNDLYKRLLEEDFPLRNKDEDYAHPSSEAHKLIAEEIYNYILNNFLNRI